MNGLFDASEQAADDIALGMLVAAAHNRCRKALNDGLRSVGIESRHFGVLVALGRLGAVSQQRLITLLNIDKSTMVRIIDELERQGLAERKRAAHDRRAYAIELTPEGRQRLEDAQRVATEVGESLFGWLRPRDREQFVNLLRQLIAHATHD